MKFANIQVLRFVAALSVLVFHLGNYAKALLGMHEPAVEFMAAHVFSAGVIVFFTISGFVLTHSLQTSSVRQFLVLRLLRIYPAYWVAAAAVIVLRRGCGESLPLDAALLRGLLLVPVGPGRANYVLAVEWSLVYEMFFYFALALFALAGPRRGVLVGAGAWMVLCLVRMAVKPSYAFLPFPKWGEIVLAPVNMAFLFGVFAYYLRGYGGAWRLWAPAAVPALFAVSYLTPRVDVMILAQGLGSGLLVAWAAAAPPAAADHPLVRYGDFSYGVYLLHAAILATLLKLSAERLWVLPSLTWLIAVGSVALLVGLLYGCLEAECYRRLRKWLLTPKRQEPAAEPTISLARAA